jgi:superfamily I DNA/RNA helicase
MSELNPKQREAAQFKDGIAAVIAVPGWKDTHNDGAYRHPGQ